MDTLMEKPFKLQHVVLYAKGWYKMTENFCEDLALMLELDGYPGYEGDREGIMAIILRHWQNWADWYNSIIPADWRKKTLESLVTVDARGIYRKYRAGSEYEKMNFTDFYDVMIMSILIDWSQADTKYMNVGCPKYEIGVWPNDKGLFSQHEWYEQAEKIGIKSDEAKVRFFNKKAKRFWKKFDK